MINIAYVDDHAMVRKAIAAIITNAEKNYCVHEFENGKDFLTQFVASSVEFSLIVTDIAMPVMNGYELTSWVRKNHSELPVLALSLIHNDDAVANLIWLGARGIVSKGSEPEILLAAIDELLQGKSYFECGLSKQEISSLIKRKELHGSSGLKSLTEQETKVLKLMASDKKPEDIAQELCISPLTYTKHKQNISDKLGIRSREGLVVYAVNVGLFSI